MSELDCVSTSRERDMALEGDARRLFEELKYRHGFPPRSAAAVVKGEFASRGLGQSSMLAQAVARTYLDRVEQILDEFAKTVLDKAGALGLPGEREARAVIA